MSTDFRQQAAQSLFPDYLEHYGVLGMKWGVRKDKYDSKNDLAVTKRAKEDLEKLSDQEFMNKYSVSKATYRKRVTKYGDPARNSPLARAGRRLGGKGNPKKGSHPEKLKKQKQTLIEKKIAKTESEIKMWQDSLDDLVKNKLGSKYIAELYGNPKLDKKTNETFVKSYLDFVGDYTADELLRDTEADLRSSLERAEKKKAQLESKR